MTLTTSRIMIPSLLMGGYRSFGQRVQRFQRFAKVNLLIGPNNSGKSNVLRFIQAVFPHLSERPHFKLGALDTHFPNRAEFLLGRRVSLTLDSEGNRHELATIVHSKIRGNHPPNVVAQAL